MTRSPRIGNRKRDLTETRADVSDHLDGSVRAARRSAASSGLGDPEWTRWVGFAAASLAPALGLAAWHGDGGRDHHQASVGEERRAGEIRV